MSKNICFISNFHLTDFYLEIARSLAKKNINIYWICPNLQRYNTLVEEWGKDHVLYIGVSSIINTQLSSDEFPAALKAIKSNDVLIRDRILKHTPELGSEYLKKLKLPVYNFLKHEDISHVFGELTWSHEIVINRICRFVHCCTATYFNPHTLRIPLQTFGFFLDEFQSTLSNHKNTSNIAETLKERFSAAMQGKSVDIPLPDYLKLNDKIVATNNKLITKFNRLIRVFNKEVDIQDPTLEKSKLRRVISGSKVFINTKIYQSIKKVTHKEVCKLSFYLYPLHKQPEASIDVIGKYYDDQLLNIRNIASQLKDHEHLVVKEHSNAIGDRSLGFYKQLNKYPRVLLVNENVNTKDLMAQSLGVFTVSGTAALEASLMGINSYCFSEVYFRGLKHCNVITLNDFNSINGLREEANSSNVHSLSNSEFANKMLLSACDGVISNPLSDQRCVTPENIIKVSNEFENLIMRQIHE